MTISKIIPHLPMPQTRNQAEVVFEGNANAFAERITTLPH